MQVVIRVAVNLNVKELEFRSTIENSIDILLDFSFLLRNKCIFIILHKMFEWNSFCSFIGFAFSNTKYIRKIIQNI